MCAKRFTAMKGPPAIYPDHAFDLVRASTITRASQPQVQRNAAEPVTNCMHRTLTDKRLR
jgi:hypothetical protein